MTVKEAIEKLHNGKKQEIISVLRTFRREGIENFVITRKEIIDTVLKALEQKDKEIQELKEDNQHQWDERCKLTFELEKQEKEMEKLKADLYECNNIISDYIDTVKEKDEIIEQYRYMILGHKKQLNKSGIYGYDYDLKILESEEENE